MIRGYFFTALPASAPIVLLSRPPDGFFQLYIE